MKMEAGQEIGETYNGPC